MSRVNLAAASDSRSNHSFTPTTVASLDLGELVPVLAAELIDSDNYDHFHADGVVRLAPQFFPPYGKCFIKNAAFFVPAYQLIKSADAFSRNMKSYKGQPTHLPRVSAWDLLSSFASISYSSVVHTSSDPMHDADIPDYDEFDFIYALENDDLTPTYQWRKFNSAGRRAYKIMKGLGFDIPSIQNSNTYTGVKNTVLYQPNVMKLLAYLKIYTDMFLSGPEYNENEIVHVLQSIHDDITYQTSGGVTYYNATTGLVSAYFLRFVYDSVLLPHESDMYTEAWNGINSPLGVSPANEIAQINSGSMMSPVMPDALQLAASSETNKLDNINDQLSAIGLRTLLAFDKFVRRHNLAGSRAAQRVYAAFGVKTDDYRSNYVRKLYEGAERIKFSPVMSNADTKNGDAGQYVGDYAGFGVSGLNFDFNYRSNDYGYLICLSWLQIVPMILRGFNPENLRQLPLDFYQPEYDGQSYRAIPKVEISVNKAVFSAQNNDLDSSVYGFTNLYEEYRHMRDNILGDFVCGLARNYVFCRDFSRLRTHNRSRSTHYPEIHPQTAQIQYYKNRDVNEKYDDMSNVFQMSHKNGDRFWLELDWDISCSRPVKSSSDALGLGVGSVQIQKNGTQMS